MKKLFILSFFMIVLIAMSVSAKTTAFLKITTQSQGEIKGDSIIGSVDGYIPVYALDFNIDYTKSETEDYKPIMKITKTIDSASPKLLQAMISGEKLSKVDLTLWDSGLKTGYQKHYFTIRLEGARVVSVRPYFPNTLLSKNKEYRHMEDIGFIYDKVSFISYIEGTSGYNPQKENPESEIIEVSEDSIINKEQNKEMMIETNTGYIEEPINNEPQHGEYVEEKQTIKEPLE